MAAEDKDQELSRWLKGELTDDQLRELTLEELQKYKQILNEVDQWYPTREGLPFTIADVTRKKKSIQRTLSVPQYLSIAASVILVIAAIWVFMPAGRTIHYADNAIKKIKLPDGKSTLTLAKGAEATWVDEDWENGTRILNLSGKGYLEVEKGGPFKVITQLGHIEVLGTAFEVATFPDGMKVTCFEGLVKATVGADSILIALGESSRHYGDRWEDKLTNEEDSAPSWIQNQTRFNNAPLKEVIATLESEFDIEVISGTVNLERRFTGTFPNDQLEVALQIVFNPFDIQYQLKGEKLYLSE